MENRENFQNIPSEEMFIAGNLLQSDEQVKTNWNSQTFFVVLTISLLFFLLDFLFQRFRDQDEPTTCIGAVGLGCYDYVIDDQRW